VGMVAGAFPIRADSCRKRTSVSTMMEFRQVVTMLFVLLIEGKKLLGLSSARLIVYSTGGTCRESPPVGRPVFCGTWSARGSAALRHGAGCHRFGGGLAAREGS